MHGEAWLKARPAQQCEITWVIPVQHALPVLHKEAFSASADQMQGRDSAHEGANVTQEVLVRSLLLRREATCGAKTATAASTGISSSSSWNTDKMHCLRLQSRHIQCSMLWIDHPTDSQHIRRAHRNCVRTWTAWFVDDVV